MLPCAACMSHITPLCTWMDVTLSNIPSWLLKNPLFHRDIFIWPKKEAKHQNWLFCCLFGPGKDILMKERTFQQSWRNIGQYYVHPGTKRSNVRHTGCTRQQHLLMGRFPQRAVFGEIHINNWWYRVWLLNLNYRNKMNTKKDFQTLVRAGWIPTWDLVNMNQINNIIKWACCVPNITKYPKVWL